MSLKIIDFDANSLYPNIEFDEEDNLYSENDNEINPEEETILETSDFSDKLRLLSDPVNWWIAIPEEERFKIKGFIGNPSLYFQAVNNWRYSEAIEYIDLIWSLEGVPMFSIGHVFEIQPFHHAIPFAKHICHERPNYGILAMLVMPKPHKPSEYKHYGKIRLLAIDHLDKDIGISYKEQNKKLEEEEMKETNENVEKIEKVNSSTDFNNSKNSKIPEINWPDDTQSDSYYSPT